MDRRPNLAIAGGWGEGPRCFRLLLPLLAEAGYQTLCLTSARWRGWRRDRSEKDYPWAQLRLAQGVNRQLATIGQPVIGIAHSMSGVYLPLAALRRPDQFEAIVLVSPAGLLEKDTFWGLVNRLSKKVLVSVVAAIKNRPLRKATLRSLWEGTLYFASNPWRAIQEARCLPACSTMGWIAELREQGVKVYAVLATDDVIFPLHLIQWARETLDGWVELEGQHDLWFYPDRLVKAILSLIEPATSAPGAAPR